MLWSPDGTRIAIAGATVQVIDVASGRLLLTFKRNNVLFRSLAWASDLDRQYIAAAGTDNMAYILDAATGKLINQRMVGSTGGVTMIAWPVSN